MGAQQHGVSNSEGLSVLLEPSGFDSKKHKCKSDRKFPFTRPSSALHYPSNKIQTYFPAWPLAVSLLFPSLGLIHSAEATLLWTSGSSPASLQPRVSALAISTARIPVLFPMQHSTGLQMACLTSFGSQRKFQL